MCKLEAVALALAALTSCGGGSSSLNSEVDYLPVQVESNGKWGMLSADGKMLFSDEFKNQPSVVINGLFSVREGDNISLYSAAAKPELVPGCDDLVSVGVYSDGVIPVTHPKGRITLIDSKGNVKGTLNPVGGKEIVSCALMMSEGLLAFETEEGLCGYCDKNGKVVIEPKYDYVYDFSEGIACVRKEINGERTTLCIDKSGKELFRIKSEFSLNDGFFRDGLLAARNSDGRCGFFNKKGEFNRVGGKVTSIKGYNSKYYVFVSDEYQCGVMDMEGNVVIRAKYGDIDLLPDNRFFAKDDKEYLVLDKKGDVQLTIDDYSTVWYINEKFNFVGRDKSHYVLLDKNGKQVGKEDYTDIIMGEATVNRGEYVTTDFFSADAVAQTILSQLTNGGYDKYSIGMPATSLGIENYYPYTYEYSYSDSAMTTNGWRYEVNFRVYTDKSIAVRESDSFYNSTVVPNKEAKVDRIRITARAAQDCWSDIKDILFAGIQSKGYTLKDNNDNWAEFDGKDCMLSISSDYGGRGVEMTISLPKSSLSDAVEVVEIEECVAVDSVVVVAE